MSPSKSPLAAAIERGLRPEGSLAAEVRALRRRDVRSLGDARAVLRALDVVAHRTPTDQPPFGSDLHTVASLFQNVQTRRAFFLLYRRGIPRLLRIFDEKLAAGDAADDVDLLVMARVFAMYPSLRTTRRIVSAARRPVDPESFLWLHLFESLVDNPYRVRICRALRDPLPQGTLGGAFLEFANMLCLKGALRRHPFDTRRGLNMLRATLLDTGQDCALTRGAVVSSLPFLRSPQRDDLLAYALDDADVGIQLTAAWASAYRGSRAALAMLRRGCLDVRYSWLARGYLEELDLTEMVPAAAHESQFAAMTELCRWLSYPTQFGRPPDEIEFYDSREMYWPPTADRRRLWLFRYHYESASEAGAPPRSESGLGLVGSVTFSLREGVATEVDADDAYALHCCFELQYNDDPRAPEELSVEAGRRVLVECGAWPP